MGYNEEHYDLMMIRVPGDTKARWQRAAARNNKSLNKYIRDLAEEKFQNDRDSTQQWGARYEHVAVRVPKGQKKDWIEAATRKNVNMSTFVRDLVDADAERELLAALAALRNREE
jgi:predicted HicB family RNase H-like nuclease